MVMPGRGRGGKGNYKGKGKGKGRGKGKGKGGRNDEDSDEGTPPVCNGPHGPLTLAGVLTKADCDALRDLWERRGHDMYREDGSRLPDASRPLLSAAEAELLLRSAEGGVRVMERECGEALDLDHCTLSGTNHVGHDRHADNEVFRVRRLPRGARCQDCGAAPLRDCRRCMLPYCSDCGPGHRCGGDADAVTCAKRGGRVMWRPGKTSYRNYACSINVTDPADFEGGDVHFYDSLGAPQPRISARCPQGDGVMFCGCRRSVHSVDGVTRGVRLVLLMWTRPAGEPPQGSVQALHRPGTGPGVWLTSADLAALADGSYGSGREPVGRWDPASVHARAAAALHAVADGPGGVAEAARLCYDVLRRHAGPARAAELLRAAGDGGGRDDGGEWE